MLPHQFRAVSSAAALLCVVSLGACASNQQPATSAGAAGPVSDPGNNDPLESVNRTMWDVDLALRDYLLTPVAHGYRAVTPDFFQNAVNNALRNLGSPAILANDLFEGNSKRAGQTLARLWLNTLVGVGGLIDVAADQGLPYHEADFGATLGAWGVPAGPYLVLPLLGPSDPRDGIGKAVDTYLDPFNVETTVHGVSSAPYYRFGVEALNTESRNQDDIEELRKSSLDFYAAVRSLYQQRRTTDVATAKNPDAPAVPNVPYDEVEPSSPVPSNPPASTAGPEKAK
jgi:phospholipid-binding lipoprotein MlaA